MSAPRGLAPREDLELELMKMGRTGPPLEPRRRPHAGKSGDPRSYNADNFDVDLEEDFEDFFFSLSLESYSLLFFFFFFFFFSLSH